jgi:hypothetical protein
MVIANPIYDVVFKFLMENDRVAKFFIGTLLEETIEEVVVRPQEYIYRDEKGIGFAVFRLDFIATVKLATGERKKVLVEIQKAKNPIDLMRFRNYLGEHYKKQDEINGQKVALPIVTIYLLGFKLDDIDSCVVKVNRQYVDLMTHQVIEKKSSFIEKLSHDCYVVQLKRIDSRFQTKLDKLLSVFEQAYFVDDTGTIKEFKHDTEDEDIRLILDRLHYFGTEPSEKKKIEDEQEALRILDLWFEDLHKKIGLKDKALEEKDKAIEEKDKALEEQEKALEEKNKALEDKNKALEEQEKLIAELKRKLSEK